MRYLRSSVLLFALALAIPGCGGDGDGGDGDAGEDASADLPAAEEPIGAAAARIPAAARGGACRKGALIHSSEGDGEPGKPSADDCRYAETKFFDLAAVKPRRSEEFGTGAYSEARAGGSFFGFAWVLDLDARWKLVQTITAEGSQFGAQGPTRLFRRSAAGFLRGVARRDCDLVWRFLDAESPLVSSRQGRKATFCAEFDNFYDDPGYYLHEFFRGVAANPDVAPVPLGENPSLAFYGVPLGPDGFYTLLLANLTTGGGGHAPAGVLAPYAAPLPGE